MFLNLLYYYSMTSFILPTAVLFLLRARHRGDADKQLRKGSRPSSEHTRTSRVGLVFVVAAVVVAVAQPPQGDAAVVLALEAVRWARVLVWDRKRGTGC